MHQKRGGWILDAGESIQKGGDVQRGGVRSTRKAGGVESATISTPEEKETWKSSFQGSLDL